MAAVCMCSISRDDGCKRTENSPVRKLSTYASSVPYGKPFFQARGGGGGRRTCKNNCCRLHRVFSVKYTQLTFHSCSKRFFIFTDATELALDFFVIDFIFSEGHNRQSYIHRLSSDNKEATGRTCGTGVWTVDVRLFQRRNDIDNVKNDITHCTYFKTWICGYCTAPLCNERYMYERCAVSFTTRNPQKCQSKSNSLKMNFRKVMITQASFAHLTYKWKECLLPKELTLLNCLI